MKKIVCLTLVLMLALSLISMPASAFTPQYMGTAYVSNSVCYINNYPINCYVMNGFMFIQVEDLNNYGFDVVWNAADSSLRILKDDNKPFNYDMNVYRPFKKELGNKLFDMHTTYVKTYIGNYAYEIECLTGKVGCTYINVDNLSVFGTMQWDNAREAMLITTSHPDKWAFPATVGVNPYKVPWFNHTEGVLKLTNYSHYSGIQCEAVFGDLNVYFGRHSEKNGELGACSLCYGTFYVDVYNENDQKVYSTSKYCGTNSYTRTFANYLGLIQQPVSCMVSVPYDKYQSNYKIHATFWCDDCGKAYEKKFVIGTKK